VPPPALMKYSTCKLTTAPSLSPTKRKSPLYPIMRFFISKGRSIRPAEAVQWYNIDRLQYALRNSLLHSRLLAEWFPQTLVSLWVMTGLYVRDRQVTGRVDSHQYGINAVKQSLEIFAWRAQKRGGKNWTNHNTRCPEQSFS
jgi:hypothetical protein